MAEYLGYKEAGIPISSKLAQFGPREAGRGFRIRPLFSAGAKGPETGAIRRQIRRPFHPDVQVLHIVNPSERGAETSFS
jgi:hypothetical protein